MKATPPPDSLAPAAPMLTTAGLARALDMAPETILRRIRAGTIKPDGMSGTGPRPTRLFKASRVEDIRSAIRGQHIVA